jgi:toxin ParE1/3/4
MTRNAADDLEELYQYIYRLDTPENADYVLDQLELCINQLQQTPNRGTFPPELLDLGIREYREVFFKPYRIIYRVAAETIYIMMIADGRRDMVALLNRRLMRP